MARAISTVSVSLPRGAGAACAARTVRVTDPTMT
jgi:hypothetical protein